MVTYTVDDAFAADPGRRVRATVAVVPPLTDFDFSRFAGLGLAFGGLVSPFSSAICDCSITKKGELFKDLP
jgi:hypothetical protein